jgi:hypothetical protein
VRSRALLFAEKSAVRLNRGPTSLT